MCRRSGCAKAPLPDCARWGLDANGACADCFQRAIDEVKRFAPTISNAYLEDYARIFLLFEDKAKCNNYLEQFSAGLAHMAVANPALKPPGKHEGDGLYVRLSMALETFERQCWFPTGHLIPLGVLTSADFLHYIRLGYVLKDYGAGVKHGEFTHRLQWHVIMRANTAGFADANPKSQGWNKTPLDLYTTLGKSETNAEAPGLWGHLLDRPGYGTTYHYPDTLHKEILKDTNAQVLVHNLSRRERKRREEFIDAYKKQLKSKGVTLAGIADPTDHDGYVTFMTAANDRLRDRWDEKHPVSASDLKKIDARLPAGAERDAAKNALYRENAAQFDVSKKELFDKTTGTIAKDYKKSKKSSHTADPLLPGGVQKVSGEKVLDQSMVNSLIINSYSGFRPLNL